MSAALPEERHRRKLHGLALRMTGCSADAEDIVQEAFLRQLAKPPPNGVDVEPWLVTVTLNLARDKLRRRRREGYRGPWLPSPVAPRSLDVEPVSPDDASTEARYSMLESVSFAFLLALEALTPMQRAVLLMRDVLDASAKETAEALGSTEGAVKVQLFRARKKLETYDRTRTREDAHAKDQALLVRFLTALQEGDADGMRALLTEDAQVLSDGGGVFHAAVIPVRGATRICSFLLELRRNGPPLVSAEPRVLGGLPFVVGEQDSTSPHVARHFALGCRVDASGKIAALYTVLAPRKLHGLVPQAVPTP